MGIMRMVDSDGNEINELNAITVESASPTNSLRFLNRDGVPVLQQLWRVWSDMGLTEEWRDVPTEGG